MTKYVYTQNKKALARILADGGKLGAPYVKDTYDCCPNCNPRPIASVSIRYVSGGIFSKMTSGDFHRYLVDNDLLYKY